MALPISQEEQEHIRKCYLEGDPDDDDGRGGAAWVFEGNHQWQIEDDFLIIDAPFQVDLCSEDGDVIEENIKLKTIEEMFKDMDMNAAWPWSGSKVKN